MNFVYSFLRMYVYIVIVDIGGIRMVTDVYFWFLLVYICGF